MLKLIKYNFIYLAAFIMLLHNVISHTHESELNGTQDQQIHQTESSSPIDFLALIFHEFTNKGEMEDIIVKANTTISFAATFVTLITINNFVAVTLFEKKEPKQYFLPLDELCQATGFSTAWSVRPPPFA